MSWVNDLAAGLGIPAGATTLAVAMYAACAAAEQAARPEALKDIGRLLKDASWPRPVQPPDVIERVFRWTFGERQLSWRCVQRSLIATFVFAASFLGVFLDLRVIDPAGLWLAFHRVPALFIAIFFLAGALPDYVAIAKSRFFLRKAAQFRRTIWSTIVLIVLDGISSYVISVVSIILAAVGTVVGYSQLPWQHTIFYSSQGPELGETIGTFAGLFWYSTMLTSVWMLLILLSTVLLRIFSPVHRFTVWFFDVDRHPVKAIGIVSATLVLIGGLIWTGLRATI